MRRAASATRTLPCLTFSFKALVVKQSLWLGARAAVTGRPLDIRTDDRQPKQVRRVVVIVNGAGRGALRHGRYRVQEIAERHGLKVTRVASSLRKPSRRARPIHLRCSATSPASRIRWSIVAVLGIPIPTSHCRAQQPNRLRTHEVSIPPVPLSWQGHHRRSNDRGLRKGTKVKAAGRRRGPVLGLRLER